MLRIISSTSLFILALTLLVSSPSHAAPVPGGADVVQREEAAQDWQVAYPAFKRDSPEPSKDWRVAYPAYKRDSPEPSKDWRVAYPAFKRDSKDGPAKDWMVAYPAF